jgi:two-component system, NtrC family, sensor kinase
LFYLIRVFLRGKYFLLVLAILGAQAAVAQDSCFRCGRDSLLQVFRQTADIKRKVQLLTLLIDFAPTDKQNEAYLDQLIQLNKTAQVIDGRPYEKLREANRFAAQKNFREALDAYHKTVELFDKHHKIIVNLLLGFRGVYNELYNQEERFAYYKKKLDYYLVNGPVENTAACYHGIGGYYVFMANYNLTISYYLRAADVFRKFYPYWFYNENGIIGIYYAEWGNVEKGLEYLNYALPLLQKWQKESPFSEQTAGYYIAAMAKITLQKGDLTSAGRYADSLLQDNPDSTNRFHSIGLMVKGSVLTKQGRFRDAEALLLKAKHFSATIFDNRMVTTNSNIEIDHALYEYFMAVKNPQAAERSLLTAYERAVIERSNRYQLDYLRELSNFYLSAGDVTKGKEYIRKYISLSDTLDAAQAKFKVAEYENVRAQLQQSQNIAALKQEKAVQDATLRKRNQILLVSLTGLLLIAVLAGFVYRQLRINRKNLHALRATQAQLVQREKMASLGELTAGIAHEIQNPLNFVNNFSEVSAEMVDELKEELTQNHTGEAILIADNLRGNITRIAHHGRRAEAIVKGMLEHSRQSTGVRELTNVNALVEEYIHLTYQGFRSRDRSFHTTIEKHLDNDTGSVVLVPQEVGRVLLNLLSNAFYSVNEKRKSADETYQPMVRVSTRRVNQQVEIRVQDNGTGIAQTIIEKIFQPFFTTKPTGEGTGLGLSLSYDIITKGHNGHMDVQSKEGEGATFIISLPAKGKA